MIKVNALQVRQLEKALGRVARQGASFAGRNTLNGLAFTTQRLSRQKVERDFTNRNQWTKGSIRVDTARSRRDPAIVGSTEKYMADQEFGAVGGPRHVPTPAASGESPRAKVRTKVVRKANRMNAVNLGRKVKRGRLTRAQVNIVALKEAKEQGKKFVYMDRGKTKGIYKVMGTKRKPKARMIQNLTRKVRRVRPHPWLRPSSLLAQEQARDIYFSELRRQLRRATSGTGLRR